MGSPSGFIADGGEAVPAMAQLLVSSGVNFMRLQALGTGLWDDSRVFGEPTLEGAWFAAPDSAGLPRSKPPSAVVRRC